MKRFVICNPMDPSAIVKIQSDSDQIFVSRKETKAAYRYTTLDIVLKNSEITGKTAYLSSQKDTVASGIPQNMLQYL